MKCAYIARVCGAEMHPRGGRGRGTTGGLPAAPTPQPAPRPCADRGPQVPWGAGQLGLGMLLWIGSFTAVGLAFVPLATALAGAEGFAGMPQQTKAVFALANQASTGKGGGVPQLARQRGHTLCPWRRTARPSARNSPPPHTHTHTYTHTPGPKICEAAVGIWVVRAVVRGSEPLPSDLFNYSPRRALQLLASALRLASPAQPALSASLEAAKRPLLPPRCPLPPSQRSLPQARRLAGLGPAGGDTEPSLRLHGGSGHRRPG